ncbi:MAG TPA: hypothetical protein DCZ95_02885 [Verrucomicrobia bacterium]|nr:MAG: hypothetical protein A2X46_13200 [Lentisphaerae bacterium GWF2_57_35]HBA83018.1 hypothetical protein [Verrucomicrobiota bacterium]
MKKLSKVLRVSCLSLGFVVLFSGSVVAGPSIFQKMDGADQDGKITADEMKARQAEWFAVLDADGDGVVLVEEMQAGSFSEMDGADQDGLITEEELAVFFVGPEKLEQYKAIEAGEYPVSIYVVEAVDQNGDGVVVIEEFVPVVKARFQQMDADQDGKVTQEEFKASRQRMHEKHDADRDGRLTIDEMK